MATRIKTPRGRCSYVNVFVPRKNLKGELKYQCMILLPKADTDMSAIKVAVKEAAEAKFGAQWQQKGLRFPVRDGDTDPNYKERPEFKGHWFMTANAKEKPGVVDENGSPIYDQTDFFSGCYGRLSVTFYGYENSGNRGVGCGLNNVQRLGMGERLDGRVAAERDFEPAPQFATGTTPPTGNPPATSSNDPFDF